MDIFFPKKSSTKIDSKSSLKFQIIEWWAKDESNNQDDSDSENEKDNSLNYSIYCFGRTDDGKSITCKINNFYPFY